LNVYSLAQLTELQLSTLCIHFMHLLQEQLGIFWGRVLIEKIKVIVEAWIQMQASPCGICCRQSGNGTGFFLKNFGFALS
jgi:hypothetical protein